jgi:protein-L-isoaspartate(D-aspartate) O-methyltransferase
MRERDEAYRRERMVREQVAARGVRDERVLQAMRELPRHLFVRDTLGARAYGEHALPIGAGQTLSQPWVVARMLELLEIAPEHSVLEVGTGSGYQTALLARLGRRVFSLERVPELARAAIRRMRDLGIDNVKIQTFDGTVGWSEVAPFDRILVAAGAPAVPPPLLDQLAPRGKLVVPEGGRDAQRLVLYNKDARGQVRRRVGEEVAFVPLVGRHGWAAAKAGESEAK